MINLRSDTESESKKRKNGGVISMKQKRSATSAQNETVTRLHHWYLEKLSEPDGKISYVARGNVTGHLRLQDTDFIYTSTVCAVNVDEGLEEAIIQTNNTEYRCRLSECNFDKPDTYDMIDKLDEYAKKYNVKKTYDLPDDAILIVLSDHETYYFEAAFVKEAGIVYEGSMYPHIGMLQDSCLISFQKHREAHDYDKQIDIRYFPHAGHLETYGWETEGLPVYLENAGESVIYYTTYEGVMELKPGKRKLVCKENVLKDGKKQFLSRGDLYPAQMLEEGEATFENGVLTIHRK